MYKGSISAAARDYADALDRLENARNYAKNIKWREGEPESVTWSYGCATTGYREMSAAVSELVKQQMPQLIKQALEKYESAQAAAARNLRNTQEAGERGLMRAGEVKDTKDEEQSAS